MKSMKETCALAAAGLALLSWPGMKVCAQTASDLGEPVNRVDLGGFTTGPLSGVRVNLVTDITSRPGLTQMATAPGVDDTLFFSERSGSIYRIDLANPDPGTNFTRVGDLAATLGTQFDDNRTTDEIRAGDGMRGLAFHPGFANPASEGFGKLYTVHEEVFASGNPTFPAPDPGDPTGRQDAVLTEWTYNPSNDSFLNAPREVIRAQMVDGHHPMQQIAFNPAANPGEADYGNLYISIGEGGLNASASTGPNPDPAGITQALDNVHGKILRINPLQSGPAPYTVPTGPGGNHFANDADPNTLSEIYAYGFRNAQTIGFNRKTGTLIVADIGQRELEEINIVENGGNFGWGVREGTYVDGVDSGSGPVFDGQFQQVLPDARDADPFIYPAIEFSHIRDGNSTGANAIVGGFVYDGQRAAELSGLYLFGNLSNEDVFYAQASDLTQDNDPAPFFQLQLEDESGNPVQLGSLIGSTRTLQRFGQDADGELYIFSQRSGQVFRLEGSRRGDLNRDGEFTNGDISAFVLALTDPQAFQNRYPDVDPNLVGDFNADRVLTNGDIAGFVATLTGSGETATTQAPTNIPEPGTALILALIGPAMIRRRR